MPAKAVTLLPMYAVEEHLEALDPLIHSILLVLLVTAFTSAAFVFAAAQATWTRLSIILITIVLDVLAVWSAVDPFSAETSHVLDNGTSAHPRRTKRRTDSRI